MAHSAKQSIGTLFDTFSPPYSTVYKHPQGGPKSTSRQAVCYRLSRSIKTDYHNSVKCGQIDQRPFYNKSTVDSAP